MEDCSTESKEGRVYVLTGVIAQDQRDYIDGVREWIRAGIPPDRMVGGPVDELDKLN